MPLAQTPRDDLHLRAENLHALSLAGFDSTSPEILCIDEIESTSPFPSNKFALVDYNHLQTKFTVDNPDVRVGRGTRPCCSRVPVAPILNTLRRFTRNNRVARGR